MAAKGTLVGLTQTELSDIRSAAVQCLTAAAVRGISYSIAGRSFTFPNLESAQALLEEVNYALQKLTGTRSTQVRANFNPGFSRS